MAKGFNKVILMGNLTANPETRTTGSGQNVTNFSLAVNRSWRGADGNTQESVSFINCVAWGKTGDIIAQYMQKGRSLLVSGRLDQRSWEDKETGGKRSAVEVVVEDFNFVDGGSGRSDGDNDGDDSGSSEPRPSAKKKDPVVEDVNDKPIDLSDIPF